MRDDAARIEIRSYRAVFDLERRIYRVDRLRLNPSGVPVRGLVYTVLAVLAVVIAARLPLLGWALGVLPWQLRYVGLPCVTAALLTILRIDGRAAHHALVAVARWWCAPWHLSAFRRCPRPGGHWTPGRLVAIADGSDGRARVRFRGPGAVLVRAPHRVAGRGRRLAVTLGRVGAPAPEGRVLVLREGATLDVRPGS